VAKVFRGQDVAVLYSQLRSFFEVVSSVCGVGGGAVGVGHWAWGSGVAARGLKAWIGGEGCLSTACSILLRAR
jgi:hypothetical protein